VRVRVGAPFRLAGADVPGDVAANTERIMSAISDLLPPEAHEAREPTAEELARSVPPGHALE
jgi:putative phosphoserine phosphatase/1-acylglycerol-3-phosphate O-acyltransferase